LTKEQLKLALNLHNIRRFQTHRLQVPKSVAEHSFRVAAIYAFLGGKEILPAMLHDIEESITGDVPSPVKKDLQGLEKYEAMRPSFEAASEKKLGKVADKLELVLDLREQLEDTGRLPRRLMEIYESELEAAMDLAKELDKAKEVKALLKELSK
jgi:5'-deoxynucleotidase YfbR-like HD superfamily hydrolase